MTPPGGSSQRSTSATGSTPSPAKAHTGAAALRQGAIVGAPYQEQSTFARGQVIQDRFKILRFIAKGGAGEVYEAQDLELRCPVALKVARPEIANNENAIERFRREIALARQVTHPNVCRIFDVFRHELPPGNAGEGPRQTLFLTMELLSGESLAARIHRLGPLTTDDALPLIEGMVAGLEAAHKVGVIHRDFKSANVVLVEDADGPRAVITDFGLARGLLPDNSDPDITVSGTVVGTPNYMSPEQLTGGKITPKVDMYALGVVIYEMVTGKRPFRGETDLSTAVKRLTESPPSPRLHTPDLDGNWERTILRCLEREAEDRFPDLESVTRALSGELSLMQPPSKQRKNRQRFLWLGAILAPVVLAILLFLASLADQSGVEDVLPIDRPPRVGVLDFQNLGESETEWLSTAMPEMIQAELAIAGGFSPIPRNEVLAASRDVGVGTMLNVADDRMRLLRRQIDADLVIEGAYLRLADGQIRLQLRVHESTGKTITLTQQGNEAQLFELISNAGHQLRDFGVGERGLPSAGRSSEVEGTTDSTPGPTGDSAEPSAELEPAVPDNG